MKSLRVTCTAAPGVMLISDEANGVLANVIEHRSDIPNLARIMAAGPELLDTVRELWAYAQSLEKIISDGVYRSEELKDPDAWKDADRFAYNGDGASMRDMVSEAIAKATGQ